MDEVTPYEQQRDRFLERLLRSAGGTFETFTMAPAFLTETTARICGKVRPR